MEIFESLKVEISLKIQVIFLSFVNLYDKISSSWIKKLWCTCILLSFQGNKWAITMRPVSIESTLLLFLLIKNFCGSKESNETQEAKKRNNFFVLHIRFYFLYSCFS